MRIAIVECDLNSCNLLINSLESVGFSVYVARSGLEGLQVVQRLDPELVILSCPLPDIPTIQMCHQTRAISDALILIMSTYRRESENIVAWLDAGADDYLRKPVRLNLLRAHIAALLRRSRMLTLGKDRPAYFDSHLTIDLHRQHVYVNGNGISLSPLQYQLLALLVRNIGQSLSMLEIVEELWSDTSDANHPHVVRLYIHKLRRLIEIDPCQPMYIITEYGFGYRFEASVNAFISR